MLFSVCGKFICEYIIMIKIRTHTHIHTNKHTHTQTKTFLIQTTVENNKKECDKCIGWNSYVKCFFLCNAKIRRERKKLYHNDITTQSTQSYNHIRQEECTGRRLAPNLCIHTFSSSFSSLSVWRRHMTVFGSRAIIQHTLTQTQTAKPRRKKMHYVCTTTSEHF